MTEELMGWLDENENKFRLAFFLCWSGNAYLKMAQRKGSTNLLFLAKNIGFILRNVLVASRKAEKYFKKSIEVARQIGAIGILGQASLGLGLLYMSKGKKNDAKSNISEAIVSFEKCGAEEYLKQAREVLASLG